MASVSIELCFQKNGVENEETRNVEERDDVNLESRFRNKMGFFFFEGNNWEKVRRKVMVVLHDLCTWKIYAREVFVL